MKTIQKERVEKKYYNVYVANDGTEFDDEQECKKYEESAKGVMMAKIKHLIVNDICEEEILGFGSSENTVWVMKPVTQDDADTILQAFLVVNPYYKEDERRDSLERQRALVQRALDEGDVIFVGRGWEMDSFWFYGTRNSMKEELDKLLPAEKNEDNA